MYTIPSSLSTDEPIMLIDRAIGFDPEDGNTIDGAAFQRELLDLDQSGYKRIKVYINSPGGVVMDGYNIYNSILKSKTPVDTFNVGIAASIAGVIFMAGRKRIMADYASLMMHNPFGGSDKKQLDAMKTSLSQMLSSRSGVKADDVAYMMDRTTWMSASECLEKGFCTEIEVTNDHNRKNMPATSAKALWKASNKIVNNLFKNDTMSDTTQGKALGISLIANYLGLNTDATENSVLSEVQSKINSAILAKTKAEEEIDNKKKEIEKMQKELDKMKKDAEDAANKFGEKCKELDALVAKNKADAEEADNKVKAADKTAKAAVAKVMVEGFVKIGKVKNDEKAIEKWVNLAVVDMDGTKAMLEEIPLNKTAAVIAVGGAQRKAADSNEVVDPNVTPASSIHYMAKVQANVNNRQK
jgi:ATP-dependent Clp protease protease subunit